MWERETESHVGHTAGGAGKLGCLSQASLQGLQRGGPGSLSLLFIAFDQVGHRTAGTRALSSKPARLLASHDGGKWKEKCFSFLWKPLGERGGADMERVRV